MQKLQAETREKYRDKYNQWLASNPTCACGCGNPIKADYSYFVHSMLVYKRPPLFFRHHRKKKVFKRKRKYEEQYQKWLMSKTLCACGCGRILHTDYYTFADSMMKRGKPPIYIKGHYKPNRKTKRASKPLKEVKNARFKECDIEITQDDSRCSYFRDCSDYLDCLEFVVVENRGIGWRKRQIQG